jgi:hypothetical protein
MYATIALSQVYKVSHPFFNDCRYHVVMKFYRLGYDLVCLLKNCLYPIALICHQFQIYEICILLLN